MSISAHRYVNVADDDDDDDDDDEECGNLARSQLKVRPSVKWRRRSRRGTTKVMMMMMMPKQAAERTIFSRGPPSAKKTVAV